MENPNFLIDWENPKVWVLFLESEPQKKPALLLAVCRHHLVKCDVGFVEISGKAIGVFYSRQDPPPFLNIYLSRSTLVLYQS